MSMTIATPAPVLGTQSRLQPQLATILAQVASPSGLTTKRILFVGDSRCSGATGLTNCSAGWFALLPSLLAQLLGETFQPYANASPTINRGLCIPTSLADPRWTIGSNWAYNNLSLGLGWAPLGTGAVFLGNGATGTLVFNPNTGTPPNTSQFCDTFDVYFLTSTGGGGTLTGQATGGAATAITINTGANSVGKQSFSASASANTNTLTLTLTGAGLVGIVGIEPRLSLASQILLGQAGVNGASAVAWNTIAANAGQGSAALINLYNPDLVVWELFGDDALVTGDSIAVAQANLLALINATVGVSKSVLMTVSNIGPAIFGAGSVQTFEAYMSGLRAFGAAQGIPVIDVDTAWGGTSAYSLLTSLYSGDQLHPNAQGYYAQARYIAQALAGIIGTM